MTLSIERSIEVNQLLAEQRRAIKARRRADSIISKDFQEELIRDCQEALEGIIPELCKHPDKWACQLPKMQVINMLRED